MDGGPPVLVKTVLGKLAELAAANERCAVAEEDGWGQPLGGSEDERLVGAPNPCEGK